ncbi:MAG: DUF6538 domain-containing protein, partial [Candidatus Thiodiazotropha sp.]
MAQQRLHQRGNTYYYRRRIPRELRTVFGRREIKISLRTSDPTIAKRLLSVYDVIYNHSFTQLQNRMLMFDIDELKKRALDLTLKKTTITADGQRVERVIEATVDEIQRLKENDDLDNLVRAALDGKDDIAIEQNAAVSAPPAIQTTNAPGTIALDELIDKFTASRLVEKEAGWVIPGGDKTKLRRLTEILGSECPVTEINVDAAEHVLSQIKRIPASTASYKNSPTVFAMISAADQQETPKNKVKRLSDKSIQQHLEIYRRLFDYACGRKIITLNPFHHVRYSASQGAQMSQSGRQAFDDDDLRALFGTELYTAFDPVKYEPFQYWAPLIAMYTGTRRAQITSLYSEDIYKTAGDIWVIDFNINTEDKRSKTKMSIRKVPVHPHLIDLNFIEFAKSKGTGNRLFPELDNWTEKELYGRRIGDWFRDHASTCIRPDGKPVYQKNRKV